MSQGLHSGYIKTDFEELSRSGHEGWLLFSSPMACSHSLGFCISTLGSSPNFLTTPWNSSWYWTHTLSVHSHPITMASGPPSLLQVGICPPMKLVGPFICPSFSWSICPACVGLHLQGCPSSHQLSRYYFACLKMHSFYSPVLVVWINFSLDIMVFSEIWKHCCL